jgi:hypothetical protein
MADSACSSCGKALATSDILYNTQGNVVCVECNAKADLQGDEQRAARNIKLAAITCAVAGVAGFIALGIAFGLAFWPSVIACIASGMFALNGLHGPGAARFVAYLTKTDKLVIWVCCGLGFALTAYEALAFGGYVPFKVWIQ